VAGAGQYPAEKIVHNHSNHSKVALALVKMGLAVWEMNDRWDKAICRG
jgi:hypothetical protein